MISLSKFKIGRNKNKKRLGRGQGSGHGQTSGKGNKGQNARAGGGVRTGFEGGQMPYIRRVPKRGFNNPLKIEYIIVNLKDIIDLKEDKIDVNILKEAGLVKNINGKKFKILGVGNIDRKINITCDKISKSAKDKIEKAGGTVEII
ncbi:MAG: 50S ribosomal protein L15 [Deltaproteobacteria bacterium]|nr:50S ribosomal protein L15 [Deltaproteobacteria bacterium]